MRILFLYPTNRNEIYQRFKNGNEPSTLMYGFCEIKKSGYDVSFKDTSGFLKKVIKYFFLPLEIIFFKLVGVSLHFDHVFSQIWEMKKSDVIISTSDSSSVPILILKKIGFLRKQKIICLSVDLINRITIGRVSSLVRNIYASANKIIVFSKEEQKQFVNKWYLTNVEYVQFGIDVDFFRKEKEAKQDKKYILTIGRDRSRDYGFFLKIATSLPDQKFVVICSQKNIENLKISENVEIVIDAGYEKIKKWFQKSFCFLLPIHELHRASGQIAYLEAFASGLPIIASPINSIKENYDLDEKDSIYFIGKDLVKWVDKIKYLKENEISIQRHNIPSIENLVVSIKTAIS